MPSSIKACWTKAWRFCKSRSRRPRWHEPLTRHTIAIGQALTSALLIHLSGGRIETHFHIFGSLAFLAFYRDWRVMVTATVVVAADHFLRGVYWPQSIFGVLTASHWRWIEHAGWVVFEDVFLIMAIFQSRREMRGIALNRAELEETNANVESKVSERTAELTTAHQELQLLMQNVDKLQRDQKLVFNAIGEGIHWINSEGTIVFENPAGTRLLGWEDSELLGRPAHATMHHTRADGSDYPQCECPIYATLRTGVSQRVDNEVFWRKDGTSIPVEYMTTPLHNEDGKIIGAVVVFADITARKRAEAERQVISDIVQSVTTTTNLDELLELAWRSIGKVLYAENCFVALHEPTTDLVHFEFWVDKFDPVPSAATRWQRS